MQFVFKVKHSTVMCSLVGKEVVRYYVNNNSNVYTCCVDATKAFDRVRPHNKLFEGKHSRQFAASNQAHLVTGPGPWVTMPTLRLNF